MCREREELACKIVTGTSLVITTIKDQLFWFLKYTQDFEVAICGAIRVKELQLS